MDLLAVKEIDGGGVVVVGVVILVDSVGSEANSWTSGDGVSVAVTRFEVTGLAIDCESGNGGTIVDVLMFPGVGVEVVVGGGVGGVS